MAPNGKPVTRSVPALHLQSNARNSDLTRTYERRGRIPAANPALLRSKYLFYIVRVMTTFGLGTLELAALLAVARLGDQAYGLAVRQELSTRTGREHSVGAIYTTLQRLEDKGLLVSHASAPMPVRGGRSRRHFSLTGVGTRAIRDAERQATSLWRGLGVPFGPEPA